MSFAIPTGINRLTRWFPLLAGLAVLLHADEKPHWAFQPIKSSPPPPVRDESWCRGSIDQFILARLEHAGAKPASSTDPRTLIRRLTFDLLGLPPASGEVAQFVDSYRADPIAAVDAAVDRLLASPQYGERWGRWWLDVARYADTNGQDENKVMANAWRYRDWVVRAFNSNKPFSEFISEQLAGDLLPASENERENLQRLVATGFLVLGPKMLAEQDKPKLVMDIIDEQIDTVGRSFLGLTLGCARCHDHKFDPVPARDYYALAGIFKSTRTMADLSFVSKFNERAIAPKQQLAAIEAHQRRLKDQTNRIDSFVQEANHALVASWKADFPRYLAAATSPDFSPADLATNVLSRLRELVSRAPETNAISRELRAFAQEPADRLASLLGELESSTNRTELRDALFGKTGIFALPKDPRLLYPPSHREKLAALETERGQLEKAAPPAADYALAVEDDKPVDLPIHLRGSHLNPAREPIHRGFIRAVTPRDPEPIPADRSGRLELARWLTSPENPLTARVIVNRVWQGHFGTGLVRSADNFGLRGEPPTHPELLDWLSTEFIRSGWDIKALHRLILRSAVFQQSSANDSVASFDPDNRLLSRFPRQRLEAEMIRDSLLAVSGRLDCSIGGSIVDWKNNEYVPGAEAAEKSPRRTIYLPIVRDRVFDSLTIFDFANPSVCSALRTPTVVSHQALFFLNSPLVKESAEALAKELQARSDLNSTGQIQEIYQRVLNRSATAAETERALQFLARLRELGPSTSVERDLAEFCQVLLASNEFVYRF